ncbi:hypothetical protein [Microvirga sp. P5_D2]
MDLLSIRHSTAPHSFSGWALNQATILDTSGSRGLLADIVKAPVLKRQAAFTVLSTVDLDDPAPFLMGLGEEHRSVGYVIRARRATDLIAAAFSTDTVPRGYLRALARIGHKPLAAPHLYRRLFEIFMDEKDSQKAHALRYCGPIDAARIQIVDVLDPALLHPEIVKRVRHVGKALEANSLVQLLKDVCSSAADNALASGLRQAVEAGDLDDFAQKWIEKADRFPPPPLPRQNGLMPLTTAVEMIEVGREMKNCLGTKIGEVVLGFAYYYRMDVTPLIGEAESVVIELNPLSNGTWVVAGISGRSNRAPSPDAKAVVINCLLRAGAIVARNPALHPKAKELAQPLGVFRYGDFELFALEDQDMQADFDRSAAEIELQLDAA